MKEMWPPLSVTYFAHHINKLCSGRIAVEDRKWPVSQAIRFEDLSTEWQEMATVWKVSFHTSVQATASVANRALRQLQEQFGFQKAPVWVFLH